VACDVQHSELIQFERFHTINQRPLRNYRTEFLAFFLLRRRRKDLNEVESQQPEVGEDDFQTHQFDEEDEIAGDYTNPVYDGKGSDDLADQFEDDAGEIL
jgi:hypothetical protein